MLASSNSTHYGTLGLNQGCTADEVREAHRALSRRYHPDRAGAAGAGGASPRAFHEMQRAYEVLRDPGRRRIYDLLGEEGVRSAEGEWEELWKALAMRQDVVAAASYFAAALACCAVAFVVQVCLHPDGAGWARPFVPVWVADLLLLAAAAGVPAAAAGVAGAGWLLRWQRPAVGAAAAAALCSFLVYLAADGVLPWLVALALPAAASAALWARRLPDCVACETSPTGDDVEDPARTVPDVLIVSSPNVHKEKGGRYELVEGVLGNGSPVWRRTDRRYWVYLGENGLWHLTKGKDIGQGTEFGTSRGFFASLRSEPGALPHEVRRWAHNRPPWTEDARIRFAAEGAPGAESRRFGGGSGGAVDQVAALTGLWPALLLFLCALRLDGVVTWSWWLVSAPAWVAWAAGSAAALRAAHAAGGRAGAAREAAWCAALGAWGAAVVLWLEGDAPAWVAAVPVILALSAAALALCVVPCLLYSHVKEETLRCEQHARDKRLQRARGGAKSSQEWGMLSPSGGAPSGRASRTTSSNAAHSLHRSAYTLERSPPGAEAWDSDDAHAQLSPCELPAGGRQSSFAAAPQPGLEGEVD